MEIKMLRLVNYGLGWAVYDGKKLLKVFADKSEAQDYCVMVANDKMWLQSNSD
jgi:hypothetical protein